MRKPLTVPELGTVLGIWAHPDDEAYLSAGLMALARDAGNRVAVATATEGELGGADRDVRRRELADSLRAVGVTEHHWLGFPDGGCADVDPRVGARAVAAVIAEVRPDTVVAFGPDGLTGHPDHRAAADWVEQAWQVDGCRFRLLQATLTRGFHHRWGPLCEQTGIWMPGAVPPAVRDEDVALRVPVRGRTARRKLAALRAHDSQTAGLRAAVGEPRLLAWWSEETFVEVPAAAEESA